MTDTENGPERLGREIPPQGVDRQVLLDRLRALSGPVWIRPMASTQAIDPPPAPISIISITGMEIGMPEPFAKRVVRATSKDRAVLGAKSSIRQILAVVPPMS